VARLRQIVSVDVSIGVIAAHAASGYDAEVLADSPLVYLKLDETSGTTAADSSGNSHDFTITGSPTLGSTKVCPTGTASYSFPGNVANYLIATGAAWMSVSSFTFEAWIRLTNTTGRQCIISHDNTTTSNRGPSWYVNSGKLSLFWAADNFSTTTLSANTDYHVAATYDGTNIRHYINGALDATNGRSGQLNPAYDLIVAASHAGGSSLSFPFNGRIDNIAYYGSKLSDARIAAHYAAA
jgi:hypothetical protein